MLRIALIPSIPVRSRVSRVSRLAAAAKTAHPHHNRAHVFSLAAFRYRNVLAINGGPINSIESFTVPVCGRRMVQANARLAAGLVGRSKHAIYGDIDGTGTHRLPSVARHAAVSEALKKWAFHSTVCSPLASDFGFDVDPSSTGISAFPGLMGRQARRKAMLEAVERFSIVAWWEGFSRWRLFDTDWPGVSAVAIDGPFGGVTVITYFKTNYGMYAYGHATEESFGAACELAVIELARHEQALQGWCLSSLAGDRRPAGSILERRCLYFASEEGHEHFLQRIRGGGQSEMPATKLICDREMPGPWGNYTTVWRFALQPPSVDYLQAGENYFFW